ncbi:MAG: hypothetical protein Q6373_002700 [Candidatus Sigynarchaeota archaeon]
MTEHEVEIKTSQKKKATGAPGQPRPRTRAKKALADQVVPLDDIIASNGIFDARGRLANVYLGMSHAERKFNMWAEDPTLARKAVYHVSLKTASNAPASISVRFTKSSGTSIEKVSEVVLQVSMLKQLMEFIQRNEANLFSEVKFFVHESTVVYGSDPVHQYLKPVLNEPGKTTKIARGGRPVSACKACDAMLLRYSFDWKMQRDDFALKDCPYCGKPLEIATRPPRVEAVLLDFNAKDCIITGTNNQIGAIYHGVPVKLTVKVQSLIHYIQNYEQLFPNSAMGPFEIRIDNKYNRINLNSMRFSGLPAAVEWRPVVLYPEDLIAW